MAIISIRPPIGSRKTLATMFSHDVTAEKITTIDEDQMVLIVGSEESANGIRKFIVSRPHMLCLSPKWRDTVIRQTRTIRRPLHSAKAAKMIALPTDDAEAVRLTLYIAHLQFHRLPETLDFPELVSLAEVAERYELNHILSAHVKGWLQPYRSRLLEPGYEQWLFIAYQFGLETEFLKLANHLAMHCSVNEARQLLTPTTNQPIEGRFPPRVLDTILTARQKTITDLFIETYFIMHGMIRSCSCAKPNATKTERFACTATNLLGLQRYLRLHGFGSPAPLCESIRCSANDIVNILIDLSLRASMRHPVLDELDQIGQPFTEEPLKRHEQCHIEDFLAEKVKGVVLQCDWAVELETFNQVRKNAGKESLEGVDAQFQLTRFIA